MKTKKGFTLIEILVVVLIIGILAAIAVPQYQKAVLKADLHRGVSLVESLYQAQQAYQLAHGDFATDIDDLDISLPLNESCEKLVVENEGVQFTCDFGDIWLYDNYSTLYFVLPNNKMAYLRFLKNLGPYKEGERFCFANPNNETAKTVCQNMGGQWHSNATKWIRYKLN